MNIQSTPCSSVLSKKLTVIRQGNKLPAFLWNLMAHYSIHRSLLDHIFGQLNQMHTFTLYFFKIYFNIILTHMSITPYWPLSFNSSPKIVCIFLSSPCMLHVLPITSLFIWPPKQVIMRTNYEPLYEIFSFHQVTPHFYVQILSLLNNLVSNTSIHVHHTGWKTFTILQTLYKTSYH